jgi:hypothetical protein
MVVSRPESGARRSAMSEQAERLFEQALALGPERRTTFVEDACRGNPETPPGAVVAPRRPPGPADDFFGLLNDAVFLGVLLGCRGPPIFRPSLPTPSSTRRRNRPSIGSCHSSLAAGWAQSIGRTTSTSTVTSRSSSCPRTSVRSRGLMTAAQRRRGPPPLFEHPNVCNHPRDRGDRRRPAVHCHGLLRGRDPEGEAPPRPLASEESLAIALQIARALAGRACARHHPPRR